MNNKDLIEELHDVARDPAFRGTLLQSIVQRAARALEEQYGAVEQMVEALRDVRSLQTWTGEGASALLDQVNAALDAYEKRRRA